MKSIALNLRPGEIVEVRSAEEIAATLDSNGALEGLMFNPEMRTYCGRKAKVLHPVRRINVVEEGVKSRYIKAAVILEGVTCSGGNHGGCQRQCLVIWKEAWLRRAPGGAERPGPAQANLGYEHQIPSLNAEEKAYSCQTTSLLSATRTPLLDIPQHIYVLSLRAKRLGLQRPIHLLYWLANKTAQRIYGFFGQKKSHLFRGNKDKTPTASLDLEPGDLVEVKTEEEILDTLDRKSRNRGLLFHKELLKYCGEKHRVLARVDKMLDERTGRMIALKNTVILEGVTCDGTDHDRCERACFCLWRDIWLRKLNQQGGGTPTQQIDGMPPVN